MGRRTTAGIIGLALLFTLTACSSGTSEAQQPTESGPASVQPASSAPTPTESQGAGIQVDENLLNVDITLPASMFEGQDMSTFDPNAYAEEEGFKKATLNDDGSITVTMSKSKHKELLDEMTAQLENTFSKMIGSADSPYIKEITHTENFSSITAKVTRAEYEAVPINFTPFTLGMSGMMYRAFTGDAVQVEVIIQDANTGDVIGSSVYPNDMGGAS